jgi:dimethylglycine dehydrogenase
MKSHTSVAVIGGGILGCSTLYHLTRLGWNDAVLIEKAELTAGSTWHAAGMVPGFAENALIARILKESLDTYAELAADSDDAVDVHRCGSIRLVRSRDEMDENRRFLAIARTVDMAAEIIGPQQVRTLYPLLQTDGVAGALWLPNDCYTDPSQTTQALARRARRLGAEIYRQTKVLALTHKAKGGWRIDTDKGSIEADVVVNCGGIWAKEVSALVGGTLPAVSIEHEYLVTEPIPEIADLTSELPMLWDMTVPMYTRADRKGLIVSCYEDHPKFFAVDGVPPAFGQELLPPDLDRTESKLEVIFRMIPALRAAGIKTVVNGPTPRSPDMRPLVGPAHGYNDFFVVCGVSGGFLFSSTTRYVAEWIVNGEPSIDLAAFDVRRFGEYADKHYAVARLSSGHAFASAAYHPHVEPHEGRPAWTTPLYNRLRARGANFGNLNGWEVPNWFGGAGQAQDEQPSYERTNAFAKVAAECRTAIEGVGILDYSSLGKFEISGKGAAAHLGRLSAGRVPVRIGEIRVAPMLTRNAHVAAAPLLMRLSDDRFYVTAAAINTQRDLHLLTPRPNDAAINVENVTARYGVLALVGPKAHNVIVDAIPGLREDPACPSFTMREVRLGSIPVHLMRLNLGRVAVWELHHAIEYQIALYEMLLARGALYDIRDIGMRAWESLRLEGGPALCTADYWTSFGPRQVGLAKFVRSDNGAFVGCQALVEADTPGRILVRLEIAAGKDARPIDPWGDEPVALNGTDVGVVTSGGFAHGRGTSMAIAQLDPEFAAPGTMLEVEILGERYPARICGRL